ncbi:hypothetical protein L9F63_014454, partial [Diploptera punctata]
MNIYFSNIFRRRHVPAVCIKHFSIRNKVFKTRLPLLFVQNNIPASYQPNLQFIRNKYKKHQSQKIEEESDSESDDDNEDGIPDKSTKTITVKVTSLRTDLIVKTGLAIARNKVETLFYDSKIRVNGKKIIKKSARVNVGDEIDVIRSTSRMNPNFLVISRIEIISAKAEEENISVKLRRTKSLTVENYDEPFKDSS